MVSTSKASVVVVLLACVACGARTGFLLDEIGGAVPKPGAGPGDPSGSISPSTFDCASAPVGSSAAPRLIAPLSTSFVTSQRPLLDMAMHDGADGACVEICRDRACTNVIATFATDGAHAQPARALPAGVFFWRARSRSGSSVGNETSAAWQFTVGVRDAAINTTAGLAIDVNGDGFGDLLTTTTNAIYVYLGGRDGLPHSPTQTVDVPGISSSIFAVDVAFAGDINGDGFGDVLASSYESGQTHLYFGHGAGLSALPDQTIAADAQNGGNAAGLGDIDGDGYGDVSIAKSSSNGAGTVIAYRGGPNGLRLDPWATLSDRDERAYPAGDIDGDRVGDVVLAATAFDPGAGRVEVLRGGASGMTKMRTFENVGPLRGYFGAGGNAGDVDGDGLADVLVGVVGTSLYAGYVDVHLGAKDGVRADAVAHLGDVGEPYDFLTGGLRAVGDVNADGFADIAIGASVGNREHGRVRIYYGGPKGPDAGRVTTVDGPPDPNAHLGDAIGGAADFNGDGFFDLAIGASDARASNGALFIYFGNAAGLNPTADETLENPNASAHSGFSSVIASRASRSRRPST